MPRREHKQFLGLHSPEWTCSQEQDCSSRPSKKAARSEGVDPLILWTIAYNETRFRPWLTSPKNAQGLMQFMPATAARFGLANPYEPSSSLLAAAKYVKYLGRLFDGKLESVLAAYNAGEGTVSAYLHGRELRVNGRVINAFKETDG
ncbi:MAG: transglycosylase SLT domain-containing protein [Chloracidobacterium sp.]|nr:transglycosylase SLT domain-containing protein [Chloracidobacterium sp.]